MRKKNLLEIIKFYGIIYLLILGGVLFYLYSYAIELVDNIFDLQPHDPFYDLSPILIGLLLFFFWIYEAFTTIRRKRYLVLTGRNYEKDISQYRPTNYARLVEYFKDADPHQLDTSIFPKINWQEANGLVFGKAGNHLITIPSNSETNVCVFGPPGSGKTSGIGIINALSFQGSVLAIDVKNDVFSFCHAKRDIARFCPDSDGAITESAHYDPFAGISDMSVTDRKLYVETMASILIPDEGGGDSSYFTSRARKFFQGIVHFKLHENPSTTFPEVVHAILSIDCFTWVKAAMKSDCLEAKELLAPFYGNSEKNISGAYDNLCTAISQFSNPVLDVLLTDNGECECISINTLESGKDIYLQIKQEHLTAYAPLFTLLIQDFSIAFTRRPDSSTGITNRPILFLLDEFPALTYSYQMINQNLSTLRSKSIIIMLICQNIAQLEKKYDSTGARAIVANCNYQVILGSNDAKSSSIYSEMFGTKKVLRISKNQSVSGQRTNSGNTVSEAREPVYLPEEFGDLGSDMILYAKGKHLRCKKLNCYKDQQKKGKKR